MARPKTLIDKVLDPAQPGPIDSAANDVLDALGEAKNGADDGFLVHVIGGKWLTFRYPATSGEIRKFKEGMFKFVARVKESQAAVLKAKGPIAVPEPMRDALAIREFDDQDLANAYTLCFYSHPKQIGGKTDEVQALTMVARKPSIISNVIDEVFRILNDGALAFSTGIVLQKKATSDQDQANGNESALKQASSME